MTELTTFPMFPSLPTELRLKIWQHALPIRVLQLAIDFPFPILAEADSSSDYRFQFSPDRYHFEFSLSPTPVSPLPTLFSTCHESRSVCLAQYIPFACSYLHPLLDTLYISWDGFTVWHNFCMKHTCAQPFIYPLALLDRIAIEFNNEILEGRHQYGDHVLELACEYCFRLMSQFGIPKELLLVRTGKIPQQSFQGWLLNPCVSGHTKIELVESDEEALPERDPETKRTDELVLQFVQQRLDRIKESPWLQAGMPRISCVDVKKEGSVELEYLHNHVDEPAQAAKSRAVLAADMAPIPWKAASWSQKERPRSWDVDGHPYSEGNVEKAIAWHRGL
jgi:hypothetical protein